MTSASHAPAKPDDEPATPIEGNAFGADGAFACPNAGSSYDIALRLPPETVRASVAIRDWLMTGGRSAADAGEFIAGLAERLNAAAVPVDRMTTAIEELHSEYSGVGRSWVKGEGIRVSYFGYGDDVDAIYRASPFHAAHESGEWLLLDLRHTPDERFGIVAELKAAGYTQYICIPIVFSIGTENGLTITTRSPTGFSERDLDVLKFIMPTVANAMELRALNARIDTVLKIYVGDDPHRAILSGAIRRGQVSRIRSAILFADMRGYTRMSSGLTPEDTVDLLNAYFDCLVPPIEAEGGEVLKYMGDGLMAIFRDRGDDTGAAAQAALDAAAAALKRLSAANRDGIFDQPIDAGIALHHGDAAYGNVGSGARLDFTVVGRDINLTSRLARLNKVLGEPLLMSKEFAQHLWADPEPLGAFLLDGITPEVEIFRPRRINSSREIPSTAATGS